MEHAFEGYVPGVHWNPKGPNRNPDYSFFPQEETQKLREKEEAKEEEERGMRSSRVRLESMRTGPEIVKVRSPKYR
eukprot:CAMPEP_0201486424 /NCGR_PEP_ID=MMETSP0151_2-20130828/10491_1 /ASSEMBLY_ACC=CAM_ASM_000257 /TAXON_ID=200890 /ORGANISM="Paramoeba atlantica, Strain 621/1 / CCAP 1560/9" /LENGTH=75 /DNA_ID=CAMNT_0047871053 /DNA_START=100 /DNA_END=323 /DNA_ORIENTATION=-